MGSGVVPTCPGRPRPVSPAPLCGLMRGQLLGLPCVPWAPWAPLIHWEGREEADCLWDLFFFYLT